MNTALPAAYAQWRGTRLGSVTERLERDLALELAGPLAATRVLDVACGDGTYAIAAAQQGAEVTGIDASEEMLGAARQRASGTGVDVRFQRADLGRLPFHDDAFDVVLCVTVLCFVKDAASAVREMARVIAPGGRLVLGELNRWSLWAAWRRLRGYLGSATWRAAKFRSAKELAALVAVAGLRIERVSGAVYFPPLGFGASVLAPVDPLPRALGTFGAAFVAVAAKRPDRRTQPAQRGDAP